MESSALEILRRQYEEVDRLQLAICDMLPNYEQPSNQKDLVMQEHTVAALLEQVQKTCQNISRSYTPGAGEDALRQELDGMTAMGGPGDFASFYSRLKDVKDFYHNFPIDRPVDDSEFQSIVASARLSDDALEAIFSGEETYGKYIDLLTHHQAYLNLKNVRRLDYLQYLQEFDNFNSIPKDTKLCKAYEKYLEDLEAYFIDFFSRAKPLFNLVAAQELERKKFQELWKEAKTAGWEDEAQKINSAEVTFCAPCHHTFLNKSVYQAHLTGRKHKKAIQNYTEGDRNEVDLNDIATKNFGVYKLALREHTIAWFGTLLGQVREETRANVERKQSRTFEEKEEEVESEILETSIVETTLKQQASDGQIYNPLNLPLDWDGKPIPYWLWKLHGLGVRFSCEICGNHIYMGRKAFDQHFYEWRHSNGMKALGIPNTRHFFQITQITEAQTLWDKLKQATRAESFRPEVMEEFEDQHGNVYSRKTYEDLRRQGLI